MTFEFDRAFFDFHNAIPLVKHVDGSGEVNTEVFETVEDFDAFLERLDTTSSNTQERYETLTNDGRLMLMVDPSSPFYTYILYANHPAKTISTASSVFSGNTYPEVWKEAFHILESVLFEHPNHNFADDGRRILAAEDHRAAFGWLLNNRFIQTSDAWKEIQTSQTVQVDIGNGQAIDCTITEIKGETKAEIETLDDAFVEIIGQFEKRVDDTVERIEGHDFRIQFFNEPSKTISIADAENRALENLQEIFPTLSMPFYEAAEIIIEHGNKKAALGLFLTKKWVFFERLVIAK